MTNSNLSIEVPHSRVPLPSEMEGLSEVKDLRDKPELNHQDILGLNFINNRGGYIFRRHYRAGLRSHILEVLYPSDVKKEREGCVTDGVRWFPRARPLKMLRIFRTKFKSLKQAEEELKTVKIIGGYLAAAHVARSEEFLVDLLAHGKREPLLCGLQEYVEGEVLDPWRSGNDSHLIMLFERMTALEPGAPQSIAEEWVQGVRKKAGDFIERLKKMIFEANHVPDLAGTGNLILTPSGHIKLVDINNISRVSFDSTILIDDRGYPVCDKSVEALSVLEHELAKREADPGDLIYRTFLDRQRMKEVKALEQQFHRGSGGALGYVE
ncbi:MAG: hypothetical protein MUO52_04825 [Desulfobacterales bacterium]|nr:hypothetical protein [Desulfobacterales bacterium]